MTCNNFIHFHFIKIVNHYIFVPWDSKVIVWGCTVRRVVIDNQHSFGSKNFTSLVISIWCKSTNFYDSNCPYFTTITSQVIILVCLDICLYKFNEWVTYRMIILHTWWKLQGANKIIKIIDFFYLWHLRIRTTIHLLWIFSKNPCH